MVCTGILVPCLTIAFWLFCVITFGFEISLPTPRSSAAVLSASIANWLFWKADAKPLGGGAAPRFVNSGTDPDVAVGVAPTAKGGAGVCTIGLVPTAPT